VRDERGFTLVELLVSLAIFGLLTAAGVALLGFSVRAQDMAGTRLDILAERGRLGALVTGDLAQAAPRIWRDEAGTVHAPFEGDAQSIAFVRRGWENFDGASRASLQRAAYRLADGRLERVAYRHVDGSSAMPPTVLISDVARLVFRYRTKEGEWRERWDPTRIDEMPRAVEMVIERQGEPPVTMLFLVGTAA